MPCFNIVKKAKKFESFRINAIINKFDLDISHADLNLNGDINIENEDWSVGLIVGSSGSGKSSIAQSAFGDNYISAFNYLDRPIIEEMPEAKTVEEITEAFNQVGLGTAWHWLKPYNVLSNGEKMRCDLARVILEDRDLIVFDEFTSVVDRQVAKIASHAISKYIKRSNKKFIAVSCHRDIIEWLEPDWVYDTDEKRFFFVKNYIKDPKLKSTLQESIENYGSILESFII